MLGDKKIPLIILKPYFPVEKRCECACSLQYVSSRSDNGFLPSHGATESACSGYDPHIFPDTDAASLAELWNSSLSYFLPILSGSFSRTISIGLSVSSSNCAIESI